MNLTELQKRQLEGNNSKDTAQTLCCWKCNWDSPNEIVEEMSKDNCPPFPTPEGMLDW